MVLVILHSKGIVDELHIVQHFFFTSFTGTFTKAAVIYEHHIIFVAGKIFCVFGPALYTAGVAMEIQNKSVWF